MTDDLKNTKLSRKEFARQLRRKAYEKAKERRANDPRYIAMKEAMRQRRRDAYQQVKERRIAARVEQKRKQKEIDAAKRSSEDVALMKLVRPATESE